MDPYSFSKLLRDLVPEMQGDATSLLETCRAKGFPMVVATTLRGPGLQARLWCQSRNETEIHIAASMLSRAGAPFAASFLKFDSRYRGRHCTNALPGESWHALGEAMDCYLAGPNRTIISDASHPGYKVYAAEAVKLGLNAGALWRAFADPCHVQLRVAASPLKAGLKWPEIDTLLIQRGGA